MSTDTDMCIKTTARKCAEEPALSIVKEEETPNYEVHRIYQDNRQIGSIELIQNFSKHCLFIENIYLEKSYRQKGYLRKIISYITSNFKNKDIFCLPLTEHIEKFKHLGFIFSHCNNRNGGNYDRFYVYKNRKN